MLKIALILCGLVLSGRNCMCQLNKRKDVALSIKHFFLCAVISLSLNSHLCAKGNELTCLFLARCLVSVENGPSGESAGSCPG